MFSEDRSHEAKNKFVVVLAYVNGDSANFSRWNEVELDGGWLRCHGVELFSSMNAIFLLWGLKMFRCSL